MKYGTDRFIRYKDGRRARQKKMIIIAISLAALFITACALIIVLINAGSGKTWKTEKEDPLRIVLKKGEDETGGEVDISEIEKEKKKYLSTDGRTDDITDGIDVSYYQGKIDWKKVADSGIDFAMIRVGYRELASGGIVEDKCAKYNMQEAQKYGVKTGIYFFSTAISEEEARKEADWVAEHIARYRITYPVAYNCEGYNEKGNRQYGLSVKERTNMAIAFLERITGKGYAPMFYASKSDMEDEPQWDMDRILEVCSVWVAQYPLAPYPETSAPDYSGDYAMWQYTSRGSVPGINTAVDMNVAYFGYENMGASKDETAPDNVGLAGDSLMDFKDVQEQVTAKEETNLRDRPSQGNDSNVMKVLYNGQVATRTGISERGWSRIVYEGQTYYAVSSLLTTDLNYKPPVTKDPESGNGIKTKFKEVNEQVTAKIEVNLRTLPGIYEPSEVVVLIKNGDVVIRTGINEDVGWSRVVYNGQTLYCISSLLEPVQGAGSR